MLDTAKLVFSGVEVPAGTPVGRENVVLYAAMGHLAAEPPSRHAGRVRGAEVATSAPGGEVRRRGSDR